MQELAGCRHANAAGQLRNFCPALDSSTVSYVLIPLSQITCQSLKDTQRRLASQHSPPGRHSRDDCPHSTHHQAEVEDPSDDIKARILVPKQVQILAGQHAAAVS